MDKKQKNNVSLFYQSPCDSCRYNPPSSSDGKPCSICPAEIKVDSIEENTSDICNDIEIEDDLLVAEHTHPKIAAIMMSFNQILKSIGRKNDRIN